MAPRETWGLRAEQLRGRRALAKRQHMIDAMDEIRRGELAQLIQYVRYTDNNRRLCPRSAEAPRSIDSQISPPLLLKAPINAQRNVRRADNLPTARQGTTCRAAKRERSFVLNPLGENT